MEREQTTYPVSFSQQRLWFIDKLQGGTPEYNMPMVFRVTGTFSLKVLTQVFETILDRHEVLRSVYEAEGGEARQRVRELSTLDFSIKEEDLSHLTGEKLAAEIESRVTADIKQAFNLAEDVMLRVCYIKTGVESGVLIFNMHHIASDGWSLEVLTKEFFALYHAYSAGKADPLPALPIQYIDYAHWQREYLSGEALERQLGYWEEKLAELPVVHSVPLDYARPATKGYEGGVVAGALGVEVSQGLEALASKFRLTPFMLLHGALCLLLSRHSNSQDIVIGTPVANRLQGELESLIGFFVNTLVLRVDTTARALSAYLEDIRAVHLGAQSNQDVPFEQLVERMKVPRSSAHSPLFQIMMTTNTDYGLYGEAEGASFQLPGVEITEFDSSLIQAKFDLNVELTLHEAGVGLRWTYDKGLFTERHIEQLNRHLCRLLEALSEVGENTEVGISSLAMLSEREVEELVYELNDTAQPYPEMACIHDLFEGQVAKAPEQAAVVFEGRTLSYRALNEKANQVAHYLRLEHGVGPDTLVGLCIERSLEMVIGIMGILKAGGAYVPLDPNYPAERLSYLLADTAVDIVLSGTKERDVLGEFAGAVVCLDGMADTTGYACADYSKENLDREEIGLTSSHLAYVIYTSGSTGQPKGVMVEHKSVVNFSEGMKVQLMCCKQGTTPGWLWLSSFTFDASLKGLCLLAEGTQLVIPSTEQAHSPEALVALIREHDIRVVNATPQLLALLAQVPNLPQFDWISSGESMGNKRFAELKEMANRHRSSLLNAYGPTEITINSHFADLSNVDSEVIGKPLNNVVCYVLDSEQQLLPNGVAGELYIGGAGIARGYLNKSELTAERFIDNPFYKEGQSGSSKRLYKTGDLVRYRPSGDLEFLGRLDDQVKIRGFRIELGEIEHSLTRLAGVDSALVIAQMQGDSKQLVGYVKPTEKVREEAVGDYVNRVKTTLRKTLPEYMVPGVILLVTEWPLTSNGKVDKKALPRGEERGQQVAYHGAQSEVEKTLVEIWSHLLDLEASTVSIKANFFDLGGHSLLSIRVVSEVRSRCGVEISVASVFDNATIEELAQVITDATAQNVRPGLTKIEREQTTYPVSFSQQRLWFIDKLQGGTPEYNMPMVFRVTGTFSLKVLTQVFETILDRHEVLRSVYEAEGGEARQRVRELSTLDFSIKEEDLSHLTGEKLAAEIESRVTADIKQAFNLAEDVMLRVCYIKTGVESGVLIFNMHHIASDGWSLEVLTKEFFALYHAYSAGKADPLPALPIQYIDYAHWQREYLSGEALERQLGYWEEKLAELPVVHSVPLDYARPATKGYEGGVVAGALGVEVSQGLEALASKFRLTPFMLLHGALCLLLSRHSNSQDIVIGTPVANRLQGELESLIGFFVNTLVLRVDTTARALSAYLEDIRAVHLGAQSNQDVPFEQLVERMKVPRSSAHSPLFQIMMTTNTDYGLYGEAEGASFQLPGVEITEFDSSLIQAKFDLNVELTLHEAGVGLRWTYDKGLFTERHIEQLNRHLCRLLEALSEVGENTEVGISSLAMLSEREVEELVYELNDTAQPYPEMACIHDLFEGQVAKAPEQAAVVFEGRTLSYRALNEKANQVAHYLRLEHGVGPDTLVGLCIERSLEMVIGIMGILKAGGAYVPLDPNYPAERLSYLLADTAVDIVLSGTKERDVLGEFAGAVVCLDGMADTTGYACADYSKENLDREEIGLTSSHLAYVIYTSGSTGQPKGVMVEHRNTVAMLSWGRETFSLTELANVLASTSLNFDLSIYELFLPLSSGTTVCIVNSILDLVTADLAQDISLINTVPSAMDALLKLEAIPQSVEVVNLAGEALQNSLVQSIFRQKPSLKVYNLYGPSEDTTYSTFACFTEDEIEIPHIGKVISNSSAFILDEKMALVPRGSIGELYLGGAGIARGYLNKSELTAERFIDNPFYKEGQSGSSKRLYKTGDLVRYRPSGDLEFLGRLDDQVKIRGFRIELGEIEHSLTRLAGVDSALVIAQMQGDSKQLVGYVKPTEKVREEAVGDYVNRVKTTLRKTLPEYMVPGVILLVTEWPLTSNGKVDKKALPRAEYRRHQESLSCT
ncbi:amino acid adenylation domain-containing protein [Pseudoalteromonas piscicida]